jgi:hypothetical protein
MVVPQGDVNEASEAPCVAKDFHVEPRILHTMYRDDIAIRASVAAAAFSQ